jgi:uncharacterized protein (DUF2141 family)
MSSRAWRGALILVLLAVVLVVARVGQAGAQGEPGHAIVVEVIGLKSDVGQIGCAIFSKEDGFPDEIDKAMKQILIKPKGKKATCTFEGYKPATYAISVIHDLDMNGELKTSIVGKPKEPWGVSNNVPAQRFGPPLYDDCKFAYRGGTKTLTVKLQK